MFTRWGRKWECLRGYSVIEPEGWFFEMWDVTNGPIGELVLGARRSEGGDLSVTQYRHGLALDVVAWFTDEAIVAIAAEGQSNDGRPLP